MPAGLSHGAELVVVQALGLQEPASGAQQGVAYRLVAGQQEVQQRAFRPHVRGDAAGAGDLAAEVGRQVPAQVGGHVHRLQTRRGAYRGRR